MSTQLGYGFTISSQVRGHSMSHRKIYLILFFFAALMLACDIPFVAQEKKATFVENTPAAPGTSSNPTADANATPDANATADANTTPGAPTASGTRRPTTPRAAPVVYVASLRVDPAQPRSGPGPVTFQVKFQSTFTTKQPFRWLVKIYRPGENKSFGETAAINTDIPPGVSEIASANNWHTNPFQCENFTARVYWVEAGVYTDPVEFKKPDGVNTPFVEFKVCP